MVNSFPSPLTSQNCFAWNPSTQLYVKWALLIFQRWLYFGCFKPLRFFTVCSALGLFPIGVSFPSDQVQVWPSLQLFSFLLSSFQTLIFSLFASGSVKISPFLSFSCCVAMYLNGTLRWLRFQDLYDGSFNCCTSTRS